MSAHPSERAPDRQRPPTDAGERIRQMIRDLDIPLDAVPQPRGTRFDKARRSHDRETRKKHRSDLRQARDAARRVFRIKPSLASRKAATAMLTAGAVGLAAFTAPTFGSFADNRDMSARMLGDIGERVPVSLLSASADFKRALIEEEGVRYVVYRDVAGYPTVGVGHLVEGRDNLRVGDRIGDRRVLDFLEADLIEAERGVRQLVGNLPLHQHEFDALVDLVYNVGAGNVSASESPRLNAAIRSADYERIAAELDYTHAAGRVARGLEFRSERRAQIFLDAHYADPREDTQTSA